MSTLDPVALLKDAYVEIKGLRARLEGFKSWSEPIAIIGMGCRFPGADTPEAFWNLLSAGTDPVTELPDDLKSSRPGAPRYAGLLDRRLLQEFDAPFFGMSPAEATMLDPQQRLLLEVAWESLERAGQPVDRLTGSRTGVFVGFCTTDYRDRMLQLEPAAQDPFSTTGNLGSIVAGRISSVLGLQGPSMAVDTACSSSLVALNLAVNSLRQGECTMALAGGVNVILSLDRLLDLVRFPLLSPDGRCRAFDARANGFVRAEGCGLVVLKRLSLAEQDGDPILAVIRGAAINHHGRSTGLTAPNVLSQQALLLQALKNAQVEPADVGYVETHGFATSLGDPIEVDALKAVLGQPRADGSRCVLGAVKTNIGHCEGASGIAGLIKVILALQHESLPALLHFDTLNPLVSFQGTSLVLGTRSEPWPRSAKPRLAGVSSFGLSGTNVHVVVEEGPPPPPVSPALRPLLLPLSARTRPALRQAAAAWAKALRAPGARPDDLAYTAAVRRSHDVWRAAATAETVAELASGLEALAAGTEVSGLTMGNAHPRPRLVFVFSGEGVPWAGMGRDLLAREPAFATSMQACDEAIAAETGWSLLQVLKGDATAPAVERADVAPPVLFALEVSLGALWRDWGVVPEVVVGHGIGEVAAACVAGILGLADAARIVCRRSRLLCPAGGRGAEAPDADAPWPDVHPQPSAIRFYATATAQPVDGEHLDAAYWERSLRDPAQLSGVLAALQSEAGTIFVEVGLPPVVQDTIPPGSPVVGGLGPDRPEQRALLEALGRIFVSGASVDWRRFYPRGVVQDAPTYPWQRQRYWIEDAELMSRAHVRAGAEDGRPGAGEAVDVSASGIERYVAGLWKEALRIDDLAVSDDVYKRGASSLLALSVMSSIVARYGIRLPTLDFLAATSVALQVELVQRGVASRTVVEPVATGQDPRPTEPASGGPIEIATSFAQQLATRVLSVTSLVDEPMVFELHGPLDLVRLDQALKIVVERHVALRVDHYRRPESKLTSVMDLLLCQVAQFRKPGVEVTGVVAPASRVSLEVRDQRDRMAQDPSQADALMRDVAEEQCTQPIDFRRGPLGRVILLRLADDRAVLYVAWSHVSLDGWACGVLLRELAAAYNALVRGEPVSLPPVEADLPDYVRWEREQFDRMGPDAVFWKTMLGSTRNLRFLTRKPKFKLSKSAPVDLSNHLMERLQERAREAGCTLSMLLLAMVALILYRTVRQDELVIGVELPNRSHPMTHAMIGNFFCELPFTYRVSPTATMTGVLADVKRQLAGIYDHQMVLPLNFRSVDAIINTVPPSEVLTLQDLQVTPAILPACAEKFPFRAIPYVREALIGMPFALMIFLGGYGREWAGFFQWDAMALGASFNLAAWLDTLLQHPDTPVSSMSVPS